MGNKTNKDLKLYNPSGINKDSKNKKGSARNIKYDVNPVTYTVKNFKKEENKDYLKIVSWNVNMEANSAYTPEGWEKENNKWKLVFEQTLSEDPDIITFQEIPKCCYQRINSETNEIEYHTNKKDEKIHILLQLFLKTNDWKISTTISSHCGYVIILAHKRLNSKYEINLTNDIYNNIKDDKNTKKWPSLILTSKKTNKICLVLFGVHLHPFGGVVNANIRKKSVDLSFELSKKLNASDYFILIGDTNMRYNEELNILKEYNNLLKSCWNIFDENEKDKILKNSMFTYYNNFFEVGSDRVSRYDKIFYGNKLKCHQLSVFDKCVSKDKYHFLSDHRAISTIVQIVE